MTNKSILSASHLMLTIYNDEKLTNNDKYELFEIILDMALEGQSCIQRKQPKSSYKSSVIDIIEESKDVLD